MNTNYHKQKLELILRDIENYTAEEFARELLRQVVVASPITITEPEFNKARLKAISDNLEERDATGRKILTVERVF